MTQDVPQEGYFYSALRSFVSRTCYANTHGALHCRCVRVPRVRFAWASSSGQCKVFCGANACGFRVRGVPAHAAQASARLCAMPAGDHLVGWANSSLRRLDQLPDLPALAASARGVVLEDPLSASLAPLLPVLPARVRSPGPADQGPPGAPAPAEDGSPGGAAPPQGGAGAPPPSIARGRRVGLGAALQDDFAPGPGGLDGERARASARPSSSEHGRTALQGARPGHTAGLLAGGTRAAAADGGGALRFSSSAAGGGGGGGGSNSGGGGSQSGGAASKLVRADSGGNGRSWGAGVELLQRGLELLQSTAAATPAGRGRGSGGGERAPARAALGVGAAAGAGPGAIGGGDCVTARNPAAAIAAAGVEPSSGADGGSALASVAVMERTGSGDSPTPAPGAGVKIKGLAYQHISFFGSTTFNAYHTSLPHALCLESDFPVWIDCWPKPLLGLKVTVLKMAGLAGGAVAAGAAAGGGYGAQTMVMLERLQALPWRRVDVSFRGTSMPFFAHNLIQARLTRRRLRSGADVSRPTLTHGFYLPPGCGREQDFWRTLLPGLVARSRSKLRRMAVRGL